MFERCYPKSSYSSLLLHTDEIFRTSDGLDWNLVSVHSSEVSIQQRHSMSQSPNLESGPLDAENAGKDRDDHQGAQKCIARLFDFHSLWIPLLIPTS